MKIYHIVQKSMENSEMALNQRYKKPALIYGSPYNSRGGDGCYLKCVFQGICLDWYLGILYGQARVEDKQ